MTVYRLQLRDDFDDFAWEVEAKGWHPAKLTVLDQDYLVEFYDLVRLSQTIADELDSQGHHYDPNVIVVRSVTRANMEQAVKLMVQSGATSRLLPE